VSMPRRAHGVGLDVPNWDPYVPILWNFGGSILGTELATVLTRIEGLG